MFVFYKKVTKQWMGAKPVLRERNWTSKIRSKATEVSDSDAKPELRGRTIDNYGWQKLKIYIGDQNT